MSIYRVEVSRLQSVLAILKSFQTALKESVSDVLETFDGVEKLSVEQTE